MTPFGTLPDGRIVHALTLRAGDLSATILTYGAFLQDLRLVGVDRSLTLGSDRLEDYLGTMAWFGSLVGPVANRIGGASAVIDGVECRFPANQGGKHTLHSGDASVCFKLWDVPHHGPDHATLTLDLSDGEGGFPGNRRVTVRFSAHAPGTLRMDVTTTTDKTTLVNFTNHGYWNLDGTETWQGHSLRIAADHYLPVDADLIPTGVVHPVEGTDMDFRQARVFAPGNPPLDHNFCVAPERHALTDVLWLTGTSGVTMTLATTEPGVQVYDGRAATRVGRGKGEGLAIEPQGWPDAPHHAHFPSILLAAGESVTQSTEWRFSRG